MCVPCEASPCPINMCMGEHWDLDYFGLIKVKILPPQGLMFPVLPTEINSKLLFPLCHNCVHKEENALCGCTREEYALMGTWCMPKVNTAINMGYEILCIYEVLHWEQNDKQLEPDLFTPYIKMFLKIKVQASGYPSNIETLKEKENYIMQYHCNEGVLLNGECINKTQV